MTFKDIVPELLQAIGDKFSDRTTKILKDKLQLISDKKATHKDSNELAIEVGNILADIFGEEINSDILPDGKMYYNIAKRLIEPSLKPDHEIISTYTADVQTMLNEQAGISLQGIEVLKTTDIIIFGSFLCLINQVISVIIKSVRLNFKSSQSKWRNDEEVFRLNSIYSQEVF